MKHIIPTITVLLLISISFIGVSNQVEDLNEDIKLPIELFIEGPTHGLAGVSYNYTFFLINQGGCEFYLYVGWGDGKHTGWLGPIEQGEKVEKAHIWKECGTYIISAVARDCNDSYYYKTLEVMITSDNTLYVGGDGPGNYTKIQDAIDNASNGDTVFVYSGIYYLDKMININKSIRLIGENKYNTIINDSGIEILVSEVSVSGFTIQNGSGISINSYSLEGSNKNTISGNIFDDYFTGFGGVTIYMNSSYNTISNNTFYNCGLMMNILNSIIDNGISYHNFVYNNTVNGKQLVYIEDTSDIVIDDAGQVILIGCVNITVENLELFNTIIGMQLLDSIDCYISDNTFSNNYFGGIILIKSYNNTISGNIILNSDGAIIIDSKYNTISENSFEKNGINIFLVNSSCNNISYNNFRYSYFLLRLKGIFSIDSDNKWIGNFWNRPRLLPVLIWGYITINPYIIRSSLDFDWHPAKQPNNI